MTVSSLDNTDSNQTVIGKNVFALGNAGDSVPNGLVPPSANLNVIGLGDGEGLTDGDGLGEIDGDGLTEGEGDALGLTDGDGVGVTHSHGRFLQYPGSPGRSANAGDGVATTITGKMRTGEIKSAEMRIRYLLRL